ncbi:hypothetical protein NP493_1020g01003 [Ridgeia piscesae]|uniref:Calponin-homology (CH) domain-containing protein n=1 Tax=Ridgeia piscesae TaxID=27915 RepID=A0AAD9KJH1_RIDPI|nr:hypothetical protein NP493_1020g01003 [Ridgeia piscesae]
MGDTSDINNMEDEERLHDLLSQTDNFDERRKIRARLRAVREKKSEEWAQKRSERETARMEANKLRQQQSEQAKQRKLKQYAEQAKDQRKGSGVVEEGIRRRMAEADAEKQRKLEQYKEIGKVMSAAYHAGSDMATRNAISVADKDKERRLQDFEEEAVTRTMSSEQLDDGSVTTTNTTVSTQKSKDGKTTTVRQTKQVTKVGGIGGTAYVTNRPGAEDTARRLANTFAQRGYPQTSGLIRVKTESWSGQDGMKHRAQKACSWSGGGRTGPRSAMAAFQNMDAANGPTGGRPNIGGGRVGVQRSASTIKQMLLDWCRSVTRGYEHVDITNFSSSWNNGMAFCALIHHFFPNAFEYSKLNPKNRRFNFTLGFEVAEKFAGIAPLLDVEDMVRMKNPDWKCVFTTVQSYYRWYRTQENKKEAEATSPSPASTPVAATQ